MHHLGQEAPPVHRKGTLVYYYIYNREVQHSLAKMFSCCTVNGTQYHWYNVGKHCEMGMVRRVHHDNFNEWY